MDKAVKDRLYGIKFPKPSKKVLHDIAEYKCNQIQMEPDIVHKKIDNSSISSVRELEKIITEVYIEEILRRT